MTHASAIARSSAFKVLVMAKSPVAGRVKTRLGAEVGHAAAADIAAAALLDTLTACTAAVGPQRCHLALDGDLDDAVRSADLHAALTGWTITAQTGDGFAERLVRAHREAGTGPLVQVGMDTPHVTPALLADAAAPLLVVDPACDAVLGSALDGGWWVLGRRDPEVAAVLAEVEMSTAHTGADTRAALERAGWRVSDTAALRDVDEVEDAEAVALARPGRGVRPGLARSHGHPGARSARVSEEQAEETLEGPYDAVVGAERTASEPDVGGPVLEALDDEGHASFTTVFSHALRGEPCQVVGLGDEPKHLPIGDWTRAADADDLTLIAQCSGATLDIGCGPGRLSAALAENGHVVLGIDVVHEAVGQTRRRGVAALRRDVFDQLPGEGRWRSALLADGNVGIGGDPEALLKRVRQLLDREGRVVVELAGPGVPLSTHWAALECAGTRSRPFRWSVVGVDDIVSLAAAVGFDVMDTQRHGQDRWSAVLEDCR